MSISEFNFSTALATSLFYNLTSCSASFQAQSELSFLFPFPSHYSSLNLLLASLSPNITFIFHTNSKFSRYAFIIVNSYCTTPILNILETYKTHFETIFLISFSNILWVILVMLLVCLWFIGFCFVVCLFGCFCRFFSSIWLVGVFVWLGFALFFFSFSKGKIHLVLGWRFIFRLRTNTPAFINSIYPILQFT